MPLPQPLVAAACGQPKNTISLVIGAGTSIEAPTCLKVSSDYAQAAHASLIATDVIEDGDCVRPGDLSCVADAVWKRTGRQQALVALLPSVEFTNAQSNVGHRTAAALMLEEVVGGVLTLNYDRAMAHALSDVGARDRVVVITRPDEHANYGGSAVIHLHRDASAPADDWVIRTAQLDEAWKGQWEELMTLCVAARPVVIFAGLGSPAAVLAESLKRIRAAVKHEVFEVGPNPPGGSAFSAEINVPLENYVQAGWCTFMEEVGKAVAGVQVEDLRNTFRGLVRDGGLSDENADVLFEQFRGLDLLALGAVRAAWVLSERQYERASAVNSEQFVDLIHALCNFQRVAGLVPHLQPLDGSVEFVADGRTVLSVFPISGHGKRRTEIERMLLNSRRVRQRRRREQMLAVLCGVAGPAPTLPENLIGDVVPEDIVAAEPNLTVVDVDDFRRDPTAWAA